MAATAERSYTCPRCWETVSIVIDLSVEGEQRFVEDCEVCCNPVEFTATVSGGALTAFSASPADGD